MTAEILGIKPEKPKEVDTGAEQAKLDRERKALIARSSFDKNTRTGSARGVTGTANIFRSNLGG